MLERKLGGVLEIYRKFQGADPRVTPMKIFPAVHYTMGGLWCDYERSPAGGLAVGSPRNQQTNIPGLFAIGECEYQYHGANRLGANSLVACIFSGLIVAPGVIHYVGSLSGKEAEQPSALLRSGGDATRPATTIARPAERRPQSLSRPRRVGPGDDRGGHRRPPQQGPCRGLWRRRGPRAAGPPLLALRHRQLAQPERDLRPGAGGHVPRRQGDPQGALLRDECRGAHYKPEFAIPDVGGNDTAKTRRQAEQWVDRFQENTRKWLKTTVAGLSADGQPVIRYEDVDTSLIPPRPRLYGMAGAEAGRTSLDGAAGQTEKLALQPTNHEPTTSPHSETHDRIPRPFLVRDSAAGQAGREALLAGSSGRLGAGHELHQRPGIDRRRGRRPPTAATSPPVAWECNCLEEVCGACTMLVNGRVRQACTALVDRLLAERPGRNRAAADDQISRAPRPGGGPLADVHRRWKTSRRGCPSIATWTWAPGCDSRSRTQERPTC